MAKKARKVIDRWWERETWRQHCIRVTAPLKDVRKGDGVLNIRSKEIAIVLEKVRRTHSYIKVLWTQKRGKHKGRKLTTWWNVENVTMIKSKKK